MNINQYIIESCDLQGATQVADYIRFARAYEYTRQGRLATLGRIIEVGKIIDPRNSDWRQVPVVFANGTEAPHFSQVDRLMDQWWFSTDDDEDNLPTAEEFYMEFERIHPFVDGNGRVGSLLYNLYRGSMKDPIHPPEFDVGVLYA